MDLDSPAGTWLRQMARLNPYIGRPPHQGKAPHKPLLLLALMDAFEGGEITEARFTRSPGLVFRFQTYGAMVEDRWPSKLYAKYPFYHLATQKIWQVFSIDGQIAQSEDSCDYGVMAAGFFELLHDGGFRREAREILIRKYFFPEEQIALQALLKLDAVDEEGQCRVAENVVEYAVRKGRSARFSIDICRGYVQTCALTGYQCMTDDDGTIVDAAHIEPWAVSQNDDIENGLALSKNAHWMFDRGLWSVDENLRIVVNYGRFIDFGPDGTRLHSFAGHHIRFHPNAKLRPSVEMLRRHRTIHGFAAA